MPRQFSPVRGAQPMQTTEVGVLPSSEICCRAASDGSNRELPVSGVREPPGGVKLLAEAEPEPEPAQDALGGGTRYLVTKDLLHGRPEAGARAATRKRKRARGGGAAWWRRAVPVRPPASPCATTCARAGAIVNLLACLEGDEPQPGRPKGLLQGRPAGPKAELCAVSGCAPSGAGSRRAGLRICHQGRGPWAASSATDKPPSSTRHEAGAGVWRLSRVRGRPAPGAAAGTRHHAGLESSVVGRVGFERSATLPEAGAGRCCYPDMVPIVHFAAGRSG